MRLSDHRPERLGEETPTLPDWETLGRLVRRDTLTAVSLHFAELGRVDACVPDEGVQVMDVPSSAPVSDDSGFHCVRGSHGGSNGGTRGDLVDRFLGDA